MPEISRMSWDLQQNIMVYVIALLIHPYKVYACEGSQMAENVANFQ